MTSVAAVGLLALGGLLIGGVISFWPERKVPAVVLGVLAALAVAGGVLNMFGG